MTPKGTGPPGFRPQHPTARQGWSEPEPDLLRNIRRALADDHPLGLLTLVSSLLSVVDPRRVNPFDRGREPGPSREELLGTFIGVDRPETSALLGAVAALGGDEVERRRIGRVLNERGHDLPAWLDGMGAAEVRGAAEMVHVLGDGDNVMVGVRLSTGDDLAAVVYIDHNLGTLVKDAFVVAESLADLLTIMRRTGDDPDTTFADIAPADAKRRIVDAIARAAMTVPPFESDSWPACRRLVEWMVSLLPDGGHGYDRPEWSEADRQRLIDRFFRSAFGEALDDYDHRGLLDAIVWFGSDYGPGDPMRWSPVAVELILVDWIPRKVVDGVDFLTKAPGLLRAFVRFCHAERNIPPYLTAQTLDAIDLWEPQYQTTIRSPRPQGPAALLAAVGAVDTDGPWTMPGEDDDEPWDYQSLMIEILQRAVGGVDALERLDTTPLPDEPFDWSGVPDDIHEAVAEVLRLCDTCCDELLDVEHRTAVRRVLARIARHGPDAFRRRGRVETAAAAICWAVGGANDLFSSLGGRRMTQKDFLAHFGVHGSVSTRADTLLKAGGFRRDTRDVALGSPDYLVSRRRRRIIDTRDRYAS